MNMKLSICFWVCAVLQITFSLDPCSVHQTCNHCIRDSTRCAWCPSEKINGSRCVASSLAATNWCAVPPEDPNSKQHVEIEEEFNSDLNKPIVQIKPQKIKMAIRAGESLNFNFSFKPAENYPVDLYFLHDASSSMEFIRSSVLKETNKVVEAINTVTQDVQLGLGFFIDKNLLPYTNEINSSITYSFMHLWTLSKDHATFKKYLNETDFGTNYDAPEGGLDALSQVITCKNKIGWRNESRKIVLFITDSPFHSAGDGKWAGLVNPYDGGCYTYDDNLYKNELTMDYPSTNIIKKLASDNHISIFFLIDNTVDGLKGTYDFMANEIGASVVTLEGENSKIAKILLQEYKKISQTIKFTYKVYVQGKVATNKIKVSFTPNCLENNINLCKVILGKKKDIVGNIMVSEYIDGNVNVEIAVRGIKEKLTLDLEVISECGCKKDESDDQCKGGGIRRCGVCECPPNRYGDLCSCDSTSSGIQDETACMAPNSTVICNGRAPCLCGTCLCEGRYRGKYCDCDNMGCPSDENGMCGGHGKCECGVCKCDKGWSWSVEASRSEVCNCDDSTKECQSDSNICFGFGDCKCGHCKCSPMCEWDVRSSYNEVCRPQPCSGTAKECHEQQCNLLKPFVFNKGSSSLCYDRVSVTTVDNLVELNETNWHLCTKVRADVGCYTNYTYKYDELNYGISLIVQTKRDCADSYFIIGGACLGALIAIGILTLIIWKLATMHRDRMEYNRFVKQQGFETSNCINPHYESASTTYVNPAFKSHQ